MFFLIIIGCSCHKDKSEKDITPPSITILGDNPYTVGTGTIYQDPGVTAYDETDGDISSKINITGNVNTSDTGTCQLKFNVSDNAGNPATEKVRTVKVIITK